MQAWGIAVAVAPKAQSSGRGIDQSDGSDAAELRTKIEGYDRFDRRLIGGCARRQDAGRCLEAHEARPFYII